VTNYLSIIVAAALVNNLLLIQLFGVSSLFYSTKRLPQAVEFSMFSFVILFLASAFNLLLHRYLLAPLGLEFFRLVVFVGTGALLTTLFLEYVSKQLPFTVRQQGLLLLLTGGNSAVLGTALVNTTRVLSLGESIIYCLGAALGYSLTIVGFAALRLRLELADVPAPFRGSAIQLITAGLVAISLLGFAGLA